MSTTTLSTDQPFTVTKSGRKWWVTDADGNHLTSFTSKAAALAEAEAENAAAVVTPDPEAVEAMVAHLVAAMDAQLAVESVVEPVVDPAALTRVERLVLAKAENLAVRAWREAGSVGEAPATPVCDWMANPSAPVAKKASAPRVTHGSFVGDVAVCTCCGVEKPANKFPTISGKPGVRGARCRQCRDTKPAT
jgi:hypothetical protein